MSTTVKASVFAAPIDLPATLDAISADLAAEGITASYSTSYPGSILPQSISVRWGVSGTDDPLGAVKAAVARNSGWFQAWGEFSIDFSGEVIVPTLTQAADGAKHAVKGAFDLTPWIVIGGSILGALYLFGPLVRGRR